MLWMQKNFCYPLFYRDPSVVKCEYIAVSKLILLKKAATTARVLLEKASASKIAEA